MILTPPRPFHRFALLLSVCWLGSHARAAVTISDAEYEGLAQFKITTPEATWFYDKSGGGFSRLIDRDGHDWISFHRDIGHDLNPGSAAAGWRGMPQMLAGDGRLDHDGGRPGFDACTSTVLPGNVIRSVTKSGRWAWTWRFTDTHAVFTMEKTNVDDDLWYFLYQGPIGGKFSPPTHFWGTSAGGPRRETPDHKRAGEEITGRWRWVYFGDDARNHTLILAQIQPDAPQCTFSYMGSTSRAMGIKSPDGMTVFGFGRNLGMHQTFSGTQHGFVVGLVQNPPKTLPFHTEMARTVEQWTGEK